MSALTLLHIFGLKGDVHACVHYFDEAYVIYAAGHNIVVYNTETKSQYKIQPVGDPREREGSNSRSGMRQYCSHGMAALANSKYSFMHHAIEPFPLTVVFALVYF